MKNVVAEYGPLQIVRDELLFIDGRNVEELTVVVDPEWLVADRVVNLTLKEYIHSGREVSEETECPLAFVQREEGDFVLYALSEVYDSELSELGKGKNTGMAHRPVLKVRQKPAEPGTSDPDNSAGRRDEDTL